MKTSKNQRIKLLISWLISQGYATNQEDLGLKLGIYNKSRLSQLVNGRVANGDFINKLTQIDRRVNYGWVVNNIGEMLLSDKKNTSTEINFEGKGVPYYDVDFIGGFDLVANDQTMTPEYYINFKEYNTADFWINVTGNSMHPELNHGDMIAIKELTDWDNQIFYGEMYAIVTTENRTVKYVRKSDKGDDWLKLVPVNKKDYDEQDIHKSIVQKVFKVLGATKRIQL